ncbi:fam-c protein [Plasmodium vinckei]|uniref:Fam-c protein n=1 Tax=Plasmodium vinckei TaxID=5860 RepID=A0A6V7T3X2_PLAVN|nr:fam-c protein [Plasmodium vinckei]
MNKRIFSLVCIALYILLSVSIYCSEQKASNVGNKSVRGTKKININNNKNGIEYKRETQLNNNNPEDDYDSNYIGEMDDDCCGCCGCCYITGFGFVLHSLCVNILNLLMGI